MKIFNDQVIVNSHVNQVHKKYLKDNISVSDCLKFLSFWSYLHLLY